jgi:diguanylate cyclase (GGDEF)-like protein
MSEPSDEALPPLATRELRARLAATRELLWISSAADAQAAAIRFVEALGGSVVPAEEADGAALPVDVSFGHGVPLLPTASATGGTDTALARALPAFVRDAHRALELAERTERLAEEASIDVLTGLPNRRAVGRALGRLRPDDELVVLDLDHFKRLNDTLGHPQGDRVLRALGEVLSDSVRARDLAGRFGGEEFIIVLSAEDGTGAEAFLERLRARWETVRPHPVTFSAGIARGGDHPQRALRQADAAMYRAKAAGRDRWCWAEAAPTEEHDAGGAGSVAGFVAFSRVEVPVAGSQELVAAFADRLRAVDAWTGFDRLEVWATPDDPTRFVMVSWWDDEAAFRAYMGSDDHRRSHARIPGGADRPRPAGFEAYRVVTR